MFASSGRVLDSFFMKILFHPIWLPLSCEQKAPDIADQLRLVEGPVAANGIAFDIMIQKLIGVEIGAVAGQIKQPDVLVVL